MLETRAIRCTRSTSAQARPARRFACGARAPARRLTTLDGADAHARRDDARDRRPRTRRGHRRRDGRRGVGSLGRHDAHRARERVVPAGVGARDQPQARPQDRSVGAVRARRGHRRRRCARSRRALALLEQIGAGTRRRRRRPTCIRASGRAAARRAAARAHLARLLGDAVPDGDVERILDAASASALTPAPDGWHVERAGLPRGRRARGRPHRGSRPPLGLRPDSRDVPGAAHGAAARRVAGVARDRARAAAALRRRPAGSRARSRSSSATPAGAVRAPTDDLVAHRQPAVGEVRGAAPVAAARACSTRWSTAGGGSRTTSGSSRSGAVFRHRRASATRVGWVLTGARGDHWSGNAGDVGLLRRQGRRRAARRGLRRATSTAQRGRRAAVVRARARRRDLVARRRATRPSSAAVGQLRPDSSRRAASARADAVVGGEIDLDALARPRRRRRDAHRRRCRATRRSSAICRLSSTSACQPRTFVARSAPTRRRRWSSVREFDRYQGKACRPAT